MLALKLLVLASVAYVAVRLALARPLTPIPIHIYLIVLVIPAILCHGRIAWGTVLNIDDNGIQLSRRGQTLLQIPKPSLRSFTFKSNSLSIHYSIASYPKTKVIGREGFPDNIWREMREYIDTYNADDRNA